MTEKRITYWCLSALAILVALPWMVEANLGGLIPFIITVPVTVIRLRDERQLRRELRRWLNEPR